MSAVPPQGQCDSSPKGNEGERRGGESFQLVRSSHIFSAAVRESLETGVLRATTDLPLTLSQLHLIRLLAVDGRCKVGEIADYLGVSAPAATKKVGRLEQFGLLSRSRGAGDRRSSIVELSLDGRRFADEYERRKAAFLHDALSLFGADEIGQLTALMDRLSIELLRLAGPDTGPCLRCTAYLKPDCSVGKLRGGCPYEAFAAHGGEE